MFCEIERLTQLQLLQVGWHIVEAILLILIADAVLVQLWLCGGGVYQPLCHC
jgi:hypothetical protein